MSGLKQIFAKSGRAVVVTPVLLLGWAVSFCAVSFHIAFPVIARHLNISTVHTAWIPTVYLIAGAVVGLPIGRVANRIGPRNAFATGIFTYIIGSVFVTLSGGFRMIAVSFFAMGAGSAMLTVTGRSLLWRVCDPQEREKVYGLLITAISIGTLSGSFMGGLIIHFLSWRVIFATGAVIGTLSLLLVLRKIPSGDGDPSVKAFDIPGALLYTLFMVAFLLGFSNFPSETSLFLIPFALLMLLAFGWFETRTPSPIIRLDFFRSNNYFRFSSVSVAFGQYSTYGIWFLLSFYLQHINSISPAETGLILGANAAVTAALSAFSSRIERWIGKSFMIILGLLLNTMALIMLALILQHFNITLIMTSMLMLGVSVALTATPITSLMIDNVPEQHRTMASATLNLAKKMGSSMSMGTVMLIFSLLLGSATLTGVANDDFLGSMRLILVIFACLSTVPLVYAIVHVIRRVRRS